MGSLERPEWQLGQDLLDPDHDPERDDLASPRPVILDPDSYDLWLDPGMTDAQVVSDLLKPYDARLMRCYPVSTRINQVANEDEDCSAPVELAEPQKGLFA